MDKAQLLAAGFNEEQATTILNLYKQSLDGQYVPKHRFDEVNTELKTTKDQLKERDTQIDGLKKFEGDSKALTDKIKELEDANKQKDTEYKANMSLEKKRNAVKLALLEDAEGKPFDADMVMGLFDLDKVAFDEATGKLASGYKEQSEVIRKDKAFLFEPKADPTKPAGWKPAGSPPKDGDAGKAPNSSESYGRSLAELKLGMMGIKPEAKTE